MRILRRVLAQVAGLVRRRGDFDAELKSHLDLHIADNIRAGMTPAEARRNALVALGGVEPTRERYRDALRAGWLDSLFKDVQFGVRTLYRNAGFTTLAIVTLAVGIAATNTAFTIVNTVLLRDLPFDRPDRIVSIGLREPGDNPHASYAEFREWERAARSFADIGALAQANLTVGDADRSPEQVSGSYVSAGTFRVLGVQPAQGRLFSSDDDRQGAPAVVILGHDLWRNRYAGDTGILGRTIRVNSQPSTVIGVMPEGFDFPFEDRVWLPLGAASWLAGEPRGSRSLNAIGRLADDATAAEAADELNVIHAAIARDFPETRTDVRVETVRFRPGIGAPWYIILGALMAAVGLLLLVSCANVANLLLARSLQRSREVSIRSSLGATRWRVIQQLLVESVMLSLAAGLLALPLSMAGIGLLLTFVAEIGKPMWMDFSMDRTVFAFLAVICVGTGVLFGVVPALYVSRRPASAMLKQTSNRTGTAGVWARRSTGALVVAEIVLTVVLVTGAVSMMRHLMAEIRVGRLIETSSLLTMNLFLPEEKFPAPDLRTAFVRRLEERLAAHPTASMAIADSRPLIGGTNRRVSLDGHAPVEGERLPRVQTVTIGPRYFDVLGVRSVRGRQLTGEDGGAGREVVVVNARFAEEFFAGADPLGRSFALVGDDNLPRRVTIVGVAPTLRHDAMSRPVSMVYLPYLFNPIGALVLLARSETGMAETTAMLREEIRSLDEDLPLFNVRTLEDVLREMLWVNRVFGGMFAIFAGMAVLIATVGIYGVVAFAMTQRTQEIGIRTALGAPRGHLWWTMMRSKIVQIGIGLCAGVAAAFLLLRLMGGLLVGRFGHDPLTLAASAAFLLMVSLVAMILPIRRATSGSPVDALRYE